MTLDFSFSQLKPVFMFQPLPITLLLLGGAYFYLRRNAAKHEGEDLTQYDSAPELFASAAPSEGMDALNAYIEQIFGGSSAKSGLSTSGWEDKRERIDAAGLARDYEGIEFRPDTIVVGGEEITGSWTLLPDSHADRRLLYIYMAAPLPLAAISATVPSPYNSPAVQAWLFSRQITASCPNIRAATQLKTRAPPISGF